MQALSVRDQLAERSRQTVRSNFAKCKSFMERQAALFRWRPPIAGSTALVEIDLEHLGRKQELAFTTTTEYCHDLAQSHGILLLPGECLGCSDRFVRIGLGRGGFQQELVAWEATLPAIPTSRETQGIST